MSFVYKMSGKQRRLRLITHKTSFYHKINNLKLKNKNINKSPIIPHLFQNNDDQQLALKQQNEVNTLTNCVLNDDERFERDSEDESISDNNTVNQDLSDISDEVLQKSPVKECISLSLTKVQALRSWVLRNNISGNATDDLLRTLRQVHVDGFPLDSRTLLNVPQTVAISSTGTGNYWHNGLKTSLMNILMQRKEDEIPNIVSFMFNIDGLPISKSSKNNFWPILCKLVELKDVKPIIVGIYEGQQKPTDLEFF